MSIITSIYPIVYDIPGEFFVVHGFQIKTTNENNKQENIYCILSPMPKCCERFGTYLQINGTFIQIERSYENDYQMRDEYEDLIESMIGSTIQSISIENVKDGDENALEEIEKENGFVKFPKYIRPMNKTAMILVHILTDRGEISIYLYNEHNGHYEHDYCIEYEDKKIEGKL